MDKISIIVPVYNVKEYLCECLDSIVNQTYKNIEIIIIDDGSTDGSEVICDEYKKKDKRIKVVHQKNKGLSVARNKGIELSTGKYISFIDSDDVIDSKMVEILYREIIKNDCDMVICGFKTFFHDYIESKDKYQVQLINRNDFFKELMINKKITNHACNKLYKKELFKNVEFVVGKKFEDIGTTYKLGFNLNLVCYLNIDLYGYRIRDGSIVGNLKKDSLLDYIGMVNYRYNDLIYRKPELINYINMNRINSIRDCFLMLAIHNKKDLLKDKEIRVILDKELVILKKIRNKNVVRINTLMENVTSRLLIISPILFFYVMRNLFLLKNIRRVK